MRKYFYFKYQNANGEMVEYSRRTTEKGAYNYFKTCCKNASVMLIKSASSIICIKGYSNIYNHLIRL